MAQPSPRARDPEGSRTAILDAAEAAFAAHGYAAASLREIAEAAGVSRATPSYFFGSKEELYRAVLDRAFHSVRDLNRASLAAASDADADVAGVLTAILEGYIDFLASHPTFVRLLQWESLTGARVAADLPSQMAGIGDGLELIERHLAPDADGREQLLVSLIALCWFPFAHADTLLGPLGLDPFDPDFVAARKRHVVELLARGLLPPSVS